MNPRDIVQSYFDRKFQPVFWPAHADWKGPREVGWEQREYTFQDYREGYRVGLRTGIEVAPGKFLHDVDIDWAPGEPIAHRFIPDTTFVFGRASKPISHCFYLLPEPLSSYKYFDIGNQATLLELRGLNSKSSDQTMVPPSVWEKEGKQEPLLFSRNRAGLVLSDIPSFIDSIPEFSRRLSLAAIGMLIAKHLGHNGFGHDPRLAWAGFLLRLGVSVDDLIKMGEGISICTNNLERGDVRTVVETTHTRLKDPKQKIKGEPAFIRLFSSDENYKEGKAIVAKIKEWLGFDSNDDFLRNKKTGEIIRDSQENIRRALSMLEADLSYNEFSEKMYIGQRVLDNPTANSLWLRIDKEYSFRPTKTFYDIVLEDVTHDREYHPVRDYLASLTWDGTPRINTWLQKYGKAPDTEYHTTIAAIVLIAAVRRVRMPGCKYDEMLVLESGQGMNKSSVLRALCPRDEWFSDDLPLDVDAKEIIERTLGKWVIEASDLAGKRKAEVELLKAMLSRQVDGPVRMAYAHFPVERRRQFIIIGTTNSEAYLMDVTGARRFWPTKVGQFDVDGILRDRDQLWAEAAHRESEGESIRLPQRLWKVAEGYQDARREVDAWEEVLTDSIETIQPASTGRKQVSADALWACLGIEPSRRDRTGAMRISEIMQRLGYYRTRIRVEGKVQVGYVGHAAGLDFSDE